MATPGSQQTFDAFFALEGQERAYRLADARRRSEAPHGPWTRASTAAAAVHGTPSGTYGTGAPAAYAGAAPPAARTPDVRELTISQEECHAG